MQTLSQARVAADPEFRYIADDMARLRKRIADNTVTLNLKDRKKELDAANDRIAERKKERASRGTPFQAVAYEVTLDNVDKPELQKVAYDRKKKGSLYDDDDDNGKKDEEDEVVPTRFATRRFAFPQTWSIC